MSAQIIGNLTGALIVTKNSSVSFFLIMGVFAIFCSTLFGLIKIPKEFPVLNGDNFDDLPSKAKEQDEAAPVTFWGDMKQTAKLLVSKEMLPFLPQQIWGGCSICYWSTMLIPIMTLQ